MIFFLGGLSLVVLINENSDFSATENLQNTLHCIHNSFHLFPFKLMQNTLKKVIKKHQS